MNVQHCHHCFILVNIRIFMQAMSFEVVLYHQRIPVQQIIRWKWWFFTTMDMRKLLVVSLVSGFPKGPANWVYLLYGCRISNAETIILVNIGGEEERKWWIRVWWWYLLMWWCPNMICWVCCFLVPSAASQVCRDFLCAMAQPPIENTHTILNHTTISLPIHSPHSTPYHTIINP